MTFSNAGILRFAYAANILILLPVCYSLLLGGGVPAVFDGQVADSSGLRLLVGSFWSTILILSVAGLAWPATLAPLLVFQILYKSLWLGLFVLPLLASGQASDIPRGVTISFVAIIIVWPLLLWKAR